MCKSLPQPITQHIGRYVGAYLRHPGSNLGIYLLAPLAPIVASGVVGAQPGRGNVPIRHNRLPT